MITPVRVPAQHEVSDSGGEERSVDSSGASAGERPSTKNGGTALRKPMRCHYCGMMMRVGEPAQFRQVSKIVSRAQNTGMPSRRLVWVAYHPTSVQCNGDGWTLPGGGYDKHVASLAQEAA